MWSAGRWRVRCLECSWRGVRTDGQCECYEDWAMYCRPGTPGPGCPRGVVWPCPRCGRVAESGRYPDGSTVVADGQVRRRTRDAATRRAA